MRENVEEALSAQALTKIPWQQRNDFLLWNAPGLQILLFLQYGVIFQLPQGFRLLLVGKHLKPTPRYLVSDKQVT